MREAEVLERIEIARAKKREATSIGGAEPHLVDGGPQAEKGKSRDVVAETVGIGSGCQYSRVNTVWGAAQREGLYALSEGTLCLTVYGCASSAHGVADYALWRERYH